MTVRLLIKRSIQTIALILAAPAAIASWFGLLTAVFVFFAHVFAVVPGFIGNFLRTGYYRLTLASCSPDTTIAFGTFFLDRLRL